MVQIKSGVKFLHQSFAFHQLWWIIYQAQLLAPDGYEITITSACDGKHAEHSKHYTGKAVDLRIRDFPKGCSVQTWAARVQRRLGDEYFVLLEDNHLHAQYNG